MLQAKGKGTSAPNSCPYTNVAVASLDQAIIEQKEIPFTEILYFGQYKDDCLVLWDGADKKLQELHSFINTRNRDLRFTLEIGN